jgi:FtsP/CotA-like multicopper oxidase with cupredoxin domain
VKGQRFRVALDNATPGPLSVHWHGLILPNGQDGVPYVTQRPLVPGARRLYHFPLEQAGTYWMHSHWGLQEQSMLTAPLILRDPSGPPDEHDVVMLLNDFTARHPAAILADLRGQGAPRAASGHDGMKNMPVPAMPGMAMAGPDLNDVTYDAFLANRRPVSDPEVIRVLPGRTVRLRIINAASGTNFFIRTGALRAEAIAVDGADIAPLPGRVFELAVAQRIDLRVRIPRGVGAYPILAQGEGTDMRAGLVLATPDASVPSISARASRAAGALPNAQEERLVPLRGLAPRAVDRTIRVGLNGDMARYVWTLNGRAWPDIVPLAVRKGERVEIAFANETGMAHPMHLHGHVFQVTEIDGMRRRGAMRDTVLVLPRQTIKVEFDAAYPGYWMIHCHLLYHQAAGMMTVLRYEGFDDPAYDPRKSLAELKH